MKRTVLLITLALGSIGYATASEPSRSGEGKYAVQLIKVRIPSSKDPLAGLSSAVTNQGVAVSGYVGGKAARIMPADALVLPDANAILEDPDTKIVTYPVVYADLGRAVTNDQTTTRMFPEDFEIVDGKAVAKETPVKLGLSIATTVTARTNKVVDLKLDFHTNRLKGFDEYPAVEGVTVKMPYFATRKFQTDVTIGLGEWVILGGFQPTIEEDASTRVFYFVKVAEAVGPPPTRGSSPKRGVIKVAADGAMSINGNPVALSELPDKMDGDQVLLEVDSSVPYRAVQEIMEALRAAGVSDVIFTTGPN